MSTSAMNHNATTTQMEHQDIFSQLCQSLTPVMDTPGQEPSSMFDEWIKQDFLNESSNTSSPEIATPLDQFLLSPPFQSKDELKLESIFGDNVDLDVSAILNSPPLYNGTNANSATTNETATKASATKNSSTTTTTTTTALNTPISPAVATPATHAASTPVVSSVTTPVSDTHTATDVNTAADTPLLQMSHLFADIGNSLPAALAALAAVAAPTPIVTPLAAPPSTPMVAPAASPVTLSKKTTASQPSVVNATTPTFSASTTGNRRKRSNEEAGNLTPMDEAAIKRQKNTDAARRSRLRKVQKMEALENRVAELEKINAGLLMRVAVLDSEKTNLKAKESSYESRIKVLEEQLTEAHKALSSRT